MSLPTTPAIQNIPLLGQNICPGGSVYFRIIPLKSARKSSEKKEITAFLWINQHRLKSNQII